MNARKNGVSTALRRAQRQRANPPRKDHFKNMRDDEGRTPTIAQSPREIPSIENADPYFLWAQNTKFARVGSILGAKGPLVQIAVELYGDRVAAEDTDRVAVQRSKAFFALEKLLGIGLRRIYFRGDGENKQLERHFTAIIPTKRMHEFVTAAAEGDICERFEMGHPLVQSPEKTHSAWTRSDDADDQPEEKLLEGKVIAVIDYGCPFAHDAFRNDNGCSRVRYMWLQDTAALLPNAVQKLPRVRSLKGKKKNNPFPYGWELRPTMIDNILNANKSSDRRIDEDGCYDSIGYDLMRQATTHGAHVLSIAAGKFNPLNGAKDEASEASIIFVQLPRRAVADASGGSMNCHVIDALRYILERTDKEAEVVVNMSFGTHAGPHDGTSILECAIDELVRRRGPDKFQIVIPAGNSFNAACHARLELAEGESKELSWEIMPDDPTDSFLEIWYGGNDREADGVVVQVRQPGGRDYLSPVALNAKASWHGDRECNEPACTIVHVESSERLDGFKNRVALIALAPARNVESTQAEARYGVWGVKITNNGTAAVTAHAWIERDDPILDLGGSTRQSRFVVTHQDDADYDYSDPFITKFCSLNSYATARDVQVVGAAIKPSERVAEIGNTSRFFAPIDRAASYSSAGPARDAATTPAINWVAYSEESDVLPGINAAGTRSRYWVRRDGTSVAAPQIARALINRLTAQAASDAAAMPSPASRNRDGGALNPEDTELQRQRIDGIPLVSW